MEITRERVWDVVSAFRGYDMGNVSDETRQRARGLLTLLRSDVHATGRADLIDLVESASGCVSASSAGDVEHWLQLLADRI
jgi:hypothetical protein